MILLHSGQTGVERGVHRAALAVGFPVTGRCGPELRDELGPLPESVRDVLEPCAPRGSRKAVAATLELATTLVIVVPDAGRLDDNPAKPAFSREAKVKNIPVHVIDPATELAPIVPQLVGEAQKVLITGPRATRWASGERAAWRLIIALADAWLPGPRWIMPST